MALSRGIEQVLPMTFGPHTNLGCSPEPFSRPCFASISSICRSIIRHLNILGLLPCLLVGDLFSAVVVLDGDLLSLVDPRLGIRAFAVQDTRLTVVVGLRSSGSGGAGTVESASGGRLDVFAALVA